MAPVLLAPWQGARAQPAVPASVALPSLGDPASSDLSPSAERKLGERAMREIRQDPDYLADPTLTDYINRVGARIAAHMGRYAEDGAPSSTELFAVRDKSINAFAMPGGFIGVNTGLLMAARSEAELAGVLAHETGHVAQRHIARSIAKDSQSGMLAMASILLALIAARNSPDAAQAALMFGQGAAAQSQLNYSRDNEREADRVGLHLLADAGYPPSAMVKFFERLQQSTQLTDSGAFPYLRTHPLTTERIGDLHARVGKLDATEPFAPEFALMQGRARVLSETTLDGLRDLRASCRAAVSAGPGSRPVSLTQRISAQYCEADASIGLRDWADAASALAQLTQTMRPYEGQAPISRELKLLGAELALAQGQAGEALAQLTPMRAAEPGNRPVAMLQAQAALRAGQPEVARESLQSWVSLHRHDGPAWKQLALAYNALNQPAAALRANAESLIIDQQWQPASEMLERARKVPGTDYYDASIIDARLHDVKEHIKEELKENRGRRAPTG
ncbi:MAG: M48 family metallopeptidase [Betaproteobacteria bacterium]|nr:M48 family metalloprotease [Betaproteobacteria bacterium]MDE2047550.1 M48 family metallopeptidase [Betaproteobacteria bacterium]